MIAAFALAAVLAGACPVERARYTLRTSPHISARFRRVESGSDWPAHLALGVRDDRSRRTFWFLPWSGGTSGLQSLSSTTDVDAPGWRPPNPDGGPRPLGDLQMVVTDPNYTVVDDIPRAGQPAPAHVLVPELGDRLWHGVIDGREIRVSAPKQFFDLAGCG